MISEDQYNLINAGVPNRDDSKVLDNRGTSIAIDAVNKMMNMDHVEPLQETT